MALFYQDSGPREEWDYLLNKQASYLSRSRGWKGKVRAKNLENLILKLLTPYTSDGVTIFQGKTAPSRSVGQISKFNPVQSNMQQKHT